jgi:glycosyltransferase involved in cell wall biosynthesis
MKFSIIIPFYNRCDTLDRAIESILNQDYQNFEMILIDDGSTDRSSEIIEKYKSCSQLKHITLPKNSGVNYARNRGLDAVSSEVSWITLLDSDDEFLPNSLSKMKRVIEKHSVQDYFRFAEVDSNGKMLCFAKEDNFIANYKSTILEKDAHGGWTVTLNKKVIDSGFRFEESVNGFESISYFELSKKLDCLYSLEVVKCYYDNTISLSRPLKRDFAFYQNDLKGNILLLERFGKDMKAFKAHKNLASILYELGKLYALFGERKKGLTYTLKAIRYYPWNLRIFRNVLMVLFANSL